MEDDLDPETRAQLRRKAKIRLLVALAIAGLATFAWVYVRYLVPKSALGGDCRYAMNCRSEAPRCMRPSPDEDGVCSRPCEVDAGDCTDGIKCVPIELDEERDERGMPLKGGYCFPKTFLDARKNKKKAGP